MANDDRKVLLRCTGCGTTNRVPAGRVGAKPVCGTCKKGLEAGRPQIVDSASFDALVLRQELPVLVDFWASWCGPCRMIAPTLEGVATKLAGRLVVAKVNVDEAQDLAARYGIQSIPCLVAFSGGAEVDRVVGALPPAQLQAFAERIGG